MTPALATDGAAGAVVAARPAVPPARRAGAARLRLLTLPILLVAVWAVLYLWVSSQPLDSIEQRTLNAPYIQARLWEHLYLSALATVLVIALAVPLGVLLTRPFARRATPLVLGLANIGQATPAIGVLVLLTLRFGVGLGVALFSLVFYSLLPVLRNTIVGIDQVDRALVEAGRGMGMTRSAVLFRIELPLAVPVILAGIRTALVIAVGVATVATFVNAGGLGDIIINGIKLQRTPVLVTGSVLVASLALLVDWLGGVAEAVLSPRGA
jgi:osmoprotectant transport system permease protein